MNKDWRTLPAPPAGFSDVLGLPPLHALLLHNRGITEAAQVGPFLAAEEGLHSDPMLLPDMGKAVGRLKEALTSGETIGVFGDFDTDGITGTALLAQTLGDLGATVITYLPDRTDEGHGLNERAVRLLHGRGVSLIVTVDCGGDSNSEVKLGTSLGIDTVITDHHSMLADPPAAYALVNPKSPQSSYPYGDLTGVGVSFKLAEALYAALGRPRPEHLLELVALGTVADVAPLTGENRYFVRRGLEWMNRTRNPGIVALVKSARLNSGSLDTESLSFGLIPRLNSAGRMEHAGISLDLLTATSIETADRLAGRLERDNRERRTLTAQGLAEASGQLEARIAVDGVPPVLVVASQDWIPGILGLIAGKLCDSYNRPAVAVSLGREISRASLRSIPEFDIAGALEVIQDLFVRHGGHARAAGFTIPTSALPSMERRLAALAEETLRNVDTTPKLFIDCEISPGLLTGETFAFIQSLAPFGEGNPAPVFMSRGAGIVEARRVGAQRDHLKLRLAHGESVWDAIAFRQADNLDSSRQAIDLVYTVGVDDWRGTAKMQLNVLDFRPAS